jgi:hypothetical protein
MIPARRLGPRRSPSVARRRAPARKLGSSSCQELPVRLNRRVGWGGARYSGSSGSLYWATESPQLMHGPLGGLPLRRMICVAMNSSPGRSSLFSLLSN